MNKTTKDMIMSRVESALDWLIEESVEYVEVERPKKGAKDTFSFELHDGEPVVEMGLFTSDGDLFSSFIPFQDALLNTEGYCYKKGKELATTKRRELLEKMMAIIQSELKEDPKR